MSGCCRSDSRGDCARETTNQSAGENDMCWKIRVRTGEEEEAGMMSGRFTAVEGVPGVRLQHVCPVLHDAASLHTLRLRLHWETDVTGQGLRDVIHNVHLQIGLVWKIQRRRNRG